MRWLGLFAVVGFASIANAAPSSNPAFLGISMEDHGVGCQVKGVTAGSAAQDAGLREWDLVLAIDGVRTPNCTSLRTQIIANTPGHIVKLDVRRGTEKIALQAPLSTRAEVLHRRLVGHEMESTNVVDADDSKHSYDLADSRGKVTVIGWFMLERCAGCSAVFDRIADGLTSRLKGSETAPFVLAVSPQPNLSNTVAQTTQAKLTALPPVRKSFGFTTAVPLAIASEETFTDLAIDDPERIHFMVVDCRGVVRFVAPIAPGSDDIDAAIDEVLAAAEQAEHSRTTRR
ncbi:MAG TPA: PDZ domain-containing protein [Kofleriaceae bacterium]|nr:PDZ domain-containing protein [Kofleriaceae bacterium]